MTSTNDHVLFDNKSEYLSILQDTTFTECFHASSVNLLGYRYPYPSGDYVQIHQDLRPDGIERGPRVDLEETCPNGINGWHNMASTGTTAFGSFYSFDPRHTGSRSGSSTINFFLANIIPIPTNRLESAIEYQKTLDNSSFLVSLNVGNDKRDDSYEFFVFLSIEYFLCYFNKLDNNNSTNGHL